MTDVVVETSLVAPTPSSEASAEDGPVWVPFDRIASASPDAIICADGDGLLTFWNDAAEALFGHPERVVLGQPFDALIPCDVGDSRHRHPGQSLALLAGQTVEIDARHADGHELPLELSVSAWRHDGQEGFSLIARSLVERRAAQDRLYRLACLDSLTGLPNRTVLMTRMVEAIGVAAPFAVLIVDLDRFKAVNDRLGHAAGDALLQAVSTRVLACLGTADTLARLGGDEFAVLLPGAGNPLKVADVAEAIVATLGRPFLLDDGMAQIGASIGAAIHPAHADTPADLLGAADLALYQAKAAGRNCLRFFGPGLRRASMRRRVNDIELRRALEAGQFELLYQPQVRLSDQSLIGAEALIRWRHPKRGLVSPASFLPALEAGRDAAAVGDWVLATACAQAAEWRRRGAGEFRIAVNLFGAQFHDGTLTDKIRTVLAQLDLPAEALELEVTENTIIRHDDAMLGPLSDLKHDGVAVAIDDYGAGNASLTLLKRYPLSRLKIDQSFVRGMCEQSDDAAIVRSVLFLGRSLGFKVTAEGVERPEQATFLSDSGFDEAQGYLFGRPVTAGELSRRFGMTGRASGLAAPSIARGAARR